jgi:hypothetical protein
VVHDYGWGNQEMILSARDGLGIPESSGKQKQPNYIFPLHPSVGGSWLCTLNWQYTCQACRFWHSCLVLLEHCYFCTLGEHGSEKDSGWQRAQWGIVTGSPCVYNGAGIPQEAKCDLKLTCGYHLPDSHRNLVRRIGWTLVSWNMKQISPSWNKTKLWLWVDQRLWYQRVWGWPLWQILL